MGTPEPFLKPKVIRRVYNGLSQPEMKKVINSWRSKKCAFKLFACNVEERGVVGRTYFNVTIEYVA